MDEISASRRSMARPLIWVGIASILAVLGVGFGLWWVSRPGVRVAPAGVALDGKIHVLGGERRVFKTADRIHSVYDPVQRVWGYRAPMRVSRMFHAAVEHDGHLFVLGGLNGSVGFLAGAEEYDPKDDRWSACPNLPTPRNRLSAAVVAGRIYAIGGMDAAGNSRAVEAYDTSQRRWTRRADLPTARHGHVALTFGGRIYVLGGYAPEPCATVEIYDPEQDRWSAGPALAVARGFFGAAVIGARIVVVGGQIPQPAPTEILEDGRWRLGAPIPVPRSRFACAALGERVYVLGGEGEQVQRVLVYNSSGDAWE